MVRISSGIKLLLFVLAITLGTSAGDLCAKPFVPEKKESAAAEEKRDPLILKLMVVNPSKKFSQTFPLKAFLPDEVKPENVLDLDELQIDYDSTRSAYYVHQNIKMEPGETVVKAIKIKDVWFVTDEALNQYTTESRELIQKIRGTDYENRARLLIINIETLLLQIYESQNDENETPAQHISTYRDNVNKLKDVEMDLMVLRRFVVSAGGMDLGFLGGHGGGGSGGGGLPVLLPSFLTETALEGELTGGNKSNQISPLVLWRIIFLVLGFMGIISLLFFAVWQQQLLTSKKRKRLTTQKAGRFSEDAVEGLNLDDFFQQKYDSRDSKKNDAA